MPCYLQHWSVGLISLSVTSVMGLLKLCTVDDAVAKIVLARFIHDGSVSILIPFVHVN